MLKDRMVQDQGLIKALRAKAEYLEADISIDKLDETQQALARDELWNQPYPNMTTSHLMQSVSELAQQESNSLQEPEHSEW